MSLPSSLSVSETTKILVERRPVLEPVLRAFEPVIESFISLFCKSEIL